MVLCYGCCYRIITDGIEAYFHRIRPAYEEREMLPLAKFLAISGIILPMLPDENIIPDINLTPYSIWLATVVVSGISYLSYLLKRYVFRELRCVGFRHCRGAL